MSKDQRRDDFHLRDHISDGLAVAAILVAIYSAYISVGARNDALAATRYNAAISGCQSADDTYRRFFLKLYNNSGDVTFESYFPGETTTFERSKVDMIDLLNSLAYAATDFETVSNEFIDKVSVFDAPLPNLKQDGINFDNAKALWTSSPKLQDLSRMPAELKAACNKVLARIRTQ